MLRDLPQSRWNFETAAHLLNRAGFGGTPAEVEELASLRIRDAVSHFVEYEAIPDPTPSPSWARPNPDRMDRLHAARLAPPEERRRLQREEQQEQRRHMLELRGWWLSRMAKGPRPLQEKMTLFWHGHFATSFEKVRDAYLMWRQNELFRRLATGSWLELLIEVAKDPAMLVWLDQAQSRKEHPNENFAREVMELFALGQGNYTEEDVTEAARALTGWSYERKTQAFVERSLWHDPGEKTIFGASGNFDGTAFLEMVVARPQAAKFITAKLWTYFAGEEPSEELASELAQAFRRAGCRFKPVLRAVLQSEAFYSPAIIRNQVKSPVQWLVGSVRMLERELPPAPVCYRLTRNLGQDLFAPPNVKGWDGGLSWITTNTLLSRYNEAATLVQGEPAMLPGRRADKRTNLAEADRMDGAQQPPVNVHRLFTEKKQVDKHALVAALERRLLQSKLKPRQEQVLRSYLDTQASLETETIVNAIRLVMSTPEYQLT